MPGLSLVPQQSSVDTSAVTAAITNKLAPVELRRTAQAIASQSFLPCRIVILGSSTTEGHGVSTFDRRFANVFMRNLRLKPGGNFVPAARVNSFPGYPVALSAGARISAATGESIGWAGRTAVLADNSSTITFTPPAEATGFQIAYGQYSGGPVLTYSIDGAAGVTINTGSPATTDRFKPSAVIPLVAGSAHTITVRRSSGTGFGYVRGFEWFVNDETSGVHVYDGGHAGWTTSDYVAAEAQWGPGITALQPDLVVMQIGPNNFTAGISAAQTSTDLQTLVNQVSARMTLPTNFMFITTSAAGSASPNQTAYLPYVEATRAVSATNSGLWVDVRPQLPSPGQPGTRYVTGDNTHLDDKGHATLGQLIYEPLRAFVPSESKASTTTTAAASSSPTGLTTFNGRQPLAGHVTPPSGGSQLSDGSQTSTTYSTAHVVTDDCTELSLVFSNWYTNGSTEVGNGNAITVGASVELADGTVVPLAWNGNRTASLAAGAESSLTDPVYVELKAGDVIYTRTYVQVASSGQTWPLGSSTTSPSGVYNAKSGSIVGSNATLTASPTWTAAGNSAYGPSAIVGRTLVPRRPIVAIVGASNTYGYGDVADSVLGFSERACQAQKVPFMKVAKPGEAGTSFASSLVNRRRRMAYVAGATHAILGYGLNDLGAGGTTFAGIAKMVLDNAGFLARVGVKRTYFVTLAPRSTSTDGWTTEANQTTTTVSNYNATRASVNAWARAGFPVVNGTAVTPGTANAVPSPLLAGIIEMADYVETGRDTGIWRANQTGDGVHASDHIGLASIMPTFRLDAADTIVTVTPGSGVAPPAATAPGAPTGLTATSGAAQASLSWTAPASNGGSPVTDYVIEFKTSAASVWSTFADGTSTGTSAIVTGLTAGTAYDFRVSAVNAVGTSAASSVASATPSAAAGGSTPTSLPGIQAWYDPSTIAQANDTDVASLADSGPNGFTATQATAATRPKLRTGANGIGGKSALWFDTIRHLVSSLPADTTPFTLITTIAPVSTGNRTIVGSQTAGGRQVRVAGANAGTQAAVLVKQGTAVISTQSNANTYTAGVLTVTWDGANVVFRFNGVAQTAGAVNAAAFTAGTLTVIGARDTANGDAFNGMIGDIVQCSGVLSAANITAEEQRQATKYGITLG